jgi:phage major head subunit gpT-like protein
MAKKDETASETIVETDPLAPAEERTEEPVEPNERDVGKSQEKERVQGIHQACRAARLPQSFTDKLIDDDVPLLEAQKRVFTELARRDVEVPRRGARDEGRVTGVDDAFVHVRAGIENALLHRCYPKQVKGNKDAPGFDLTDEGRPYRGMTLLRIAEAYLSHTGVRTTGLSKMEMAGLALGLDTRSGMHTTSDFALLLADVANKTLRAAYNAAPQTFQPIARRVTLPDFKSVKRLQLGEAPALLEVKEHGEFTHGTIGESKEEYALLTYGRIFAITRKAIVNDDTDAFSRVPMLFGRSARNLESDLVWAQITSNPLMGDGVALFATGHSNLAGTPSVIDIVNVGIGRAAMRNQTALDAVTKLNLNPQFLIVPPALETVADQFVSVNLMATAFTVVNPFAGRLQVISEPRLEAADANAWFLGASPDQIDMIEYGFLEGEEGPMVESRVGFDVDGLEIKAREDFGTKVIDHRGLFKNAGA